VKSSFWNFWVSKCDGFPQFVPADRAVKEYCTLKKFFEGVSLVAEGFFHPSALCFFRRI
jgi:hypothetical protein